MQTFRVVFAVAALFQQVMGFIKLYQSTIPEPPEGFAMPDLESLVRQAISAECMLHTCCINWVPVAFHEIYKKAVEKIRMEYSWRHSGFPAWIQMMEIALMKAFRAALIYFMGECPSYRPLASEVFKNNSDLKAVVAGFQRKQWWGLGLNAGETQDEVEVGLKEAFVGVCARPNSCVSDVRTVTGLLGQETGKLVAKIAREEDRVKWQELVDSLPEHFRKVCEAPARPLRSNKRQRQDGGADQEPPEASPVILPLLHFVVIKSFS